MALEDTIVTNVELAGRRAYLAGAQEVAAGTREMGVASEYTGRQMERAGKRGLVMTQAIFTVRRMLYGTTLGFIALGAESLKWGWQFNTAMQQGRVVLGAFFHSTRLANKELNLLFQFSKYTPFQFKDVVNAAAVLMRFNVSASMSNRVIRNLTDAIAGTSKATPAGLNRLSLALGHMMSIGHVTGRVLQQLAQDGIPGVYEATKKYFHLTSSQMTHIGALGLNSGQELIALNQYIEHSSKLHGLAKKLALQSFHGQFTTFKDNMGQIMGTVEKGWFGRLQGVLTRTNNFFNSLSNTLKGKGSLMGLMKAVDSKLTPGSHGILMFWRQLSGALHDVWIIFKNVLDVVVHSTMIWASLYLGLTLLHGVLAVVANTTSAWRTPLSIVIGLMIFWRVATITLTVAQTAWLFVMRAGWVAIRLFYLAEALYTIWTMRATVATLLQARAQMFALVSLRALILGLIILRNVAILSAILGLRLFQIGLGSLSANLEAVMFRLRMLRLGMLGLAGLVISAVVLLELVPHAKKNRDPRAPSNNPVQHFFTKLPVVGGTASQIGAASDWINKRLHHWGIPGFAAGGSTPYSGSFWVGERGPEIATLPGGTRITPNHQASQFNLGESWMKGQDRQPIILKIGERVLESIVVDLQTGRLARA